MDDYSDNILIRKFECYTKLAKEDKALLRSVSSERLRFADPRTDIISQGDNPQTLMFVLAGWVSRYKVLADGRRQTIALLLPGDICDLNAFLLRKMDHSVAAVNSVAYAEINHEAFETLMHSFPRISRAMWWANLVATSVQREWTLNLARRTSRERMAHTFCELFMRLQAVGMTMGPSFHFPLTQVEFAEALGTSAVHVSRSLQELRDAGLIKWIGKTVTIPDFAALQSEALFEPDYLHLGRIGARFNAKD